MTEPKCNVKRQHGFSIESMLRYRSGLCVESRLVVMDGDFAVDAVVERNQSLCARHSVNHLDTVIEQFHQMLVIPCIKLDEHGVGTGGEVALHYFRDFFQVQGLRRGTLRLVQG